MRTRREIGQWISGNYPLLSDDRLTRAINMVTVTECYGDRPRLEQIINEVTADLVLVPDSDVRASDADQPTDSLSDETLIAYIGAHPGVKLAEICHAHNIPWAHAAPVYGYTNQAKRLRKQMQRLRRAGTISPRRDQGWIINE